MSDSERLIPSFVMFCGQYALMSLGRSTSLEHAHGSAASLDTAVVGPDAREPEKSSERFEAAFCASNVRLVARIALRDAARRLPSFGRELGIEIVHSCPFELV